MTTAPHTSDERLRETFQNVLVEHHGEGLAEIFWSALLPHWDDIAEAVRRTQSPAPQPADDGEGELILQLRRQAVEWSAFSAQSLSLTNKEHYAQVANSCRDAASALERRSHALSPAQDTAGLVNRLREMAGHRETFELSADGVHTCIRYIEVLQKLLRQAADALASAPSKPAPVGERESHT